MQHIQSLRDSGTKRFADAVTALVEIGLPVVATLINTLKDSDEYIRGGAVIALGRIGDPRAIPPLCETLQSSDPTIKWYCVWALIGIGEPAVLPLIDLLNDEVPSVRHHVAIALGKTGDARAVLPLIQGLHEIGSHAAEALGEIGDTRAVLPLIDALSRGDYILREYSAYALGSIGDARAILPLCKALKDREGTVRSSAEGALAHMRDAGAPLPFYVLVSRVLTITEKIDAMTALLNVEPWKSVLPIGSIDRYCREVLSRRDLPADIRQEVEQVRREARKEHR